MTDRDGVNKEVFEHNMKTIHKSLDRLTKLVEKLFDKQDEMNTVLTKNTVVVKEHHLRSNRLEHISETISKQVVAMGKQLTETIVKVSELYSDIQPIKTHVSEIDKTVGVIKGIPTVLKVILTVLMIATSSIGLFTIVKDIANKPNQVEKVNQVKKVNP